MRISLTGLRTLCPQTEYSSAPQAGSWPVIHKMTSGQSRQEEIFQLNTKYSRGRCACFKKFAVQMAPEPFPQFPI